MNNNILYKNKYHGIKNVKNYISYILTCSLLITFSCHSVKKDVDSEKFERQTSEISTDEMLIGDDLNFYGSDAPNAGIFFLKAETNFLRGFAIKPLRFQEGDKTLDQLSKQLNTSPIYQIELYELDPGENITPENPNICDYISENSAKARIIFGANGISFRVKERNWISINKKINPEAIIFVRLGIGEPFSVIKNNATDGFWIKAKKNDKPWENFNSFDKKKLISWTCQEVNFLETKRYEALFYNPDIVFQYD